MNSLIENLKEEAKKEIYEDILPFWMCEMVDNEHGGFYGRMDGLGKIHPEADKGAIMNSRILWFFSAAYNILKDERCLFYANRAKSYLLENFIDRIYGGVYWNLDFLGHPINTKKQTYAIGFAIYGLTEYAIATRNIEALEIAIKLYHDIESHAFAYDGYIEALDRDWSQISDMRLSNKDVNCSKTMNSHLHIIEPYTNLLKCLSLGCFKDFSSEKEEVRTSVRKLIIIFLEKIINPTSHHLNLFFDDNWKVLGNQQSFGHDIEAVWLLHDSAIALNEENCLSRVESLIPKIALASEEGLQPDGSLIYERDLDSGHTDTQRQWWVLCENVIGHLDLYQHFGGEKNLSIALECWEYIKAHLLDKKNGEWYWAVDDKGRPDKANDKAGFWKGPYHNGRMCLEIIKRQY